jgi:tetratricopeptide (TPR) repeat protein
MPGRKKTVSASSSTTEASAMTKANLSALTPLGASRHEFPVLSQTGQILQTSKRFGHSAVWQLMQDFYEHESISAWNQVPFLITCSAMMADAYSDFILGYWQDLPSDCPLHIVELSTGSGRLSYLILKLLSEKIRRFPALADRSFKYVMTDCAQKNIDFWMSHPHFQPFIKHDVLDFARFNPMTDTEIHLILEDKRLENTAIVGIANYCFDTLPNDFFQVREKTLYEAQVELTLKPEENSTELPEKVTRRTVQPLVSYQKATADYYPYPLWNDILADQAEHYYNASFYFPFGGLSALEALKASSNGELMLVSSDKGYVKKEFHLGLEDPNCAFHGGAFSIMVNYDIVLDWFNRQGAVSASSIKDSSLSVETVVCALGDSPRPNLQQATHWHLDRCNTIGGSWEFLMAATYLEPTSSDVKNRKMVHQILGALRMSLADPYLMSDFAPTLAQLSEYIGGYTRKDVLRLAARAWELYYPFPGEPNLPYKLGVLFLCLGDYEKVLACCKAASQLYPPDAHLYTLMGRVNEKLHRYRLSLECYHKALELNPKAEIPNERLNALQLLLAQNTSDEDLFRALNDYNFAETAEKIQLNLKNS